MFCLSFTSYASADVYLAGELIIHEASAVQSILVK